MEIGLDALPQPAQPVKPELYLYGLGYSNILSGKRPPPIIPLPLPSWQRLHYIEYALSLLVLEFLFWVYPKLRKAFFLKIICESYSNLYYKERKELKLAFT